MRKTTAARRLRRAKATVESMALRGELEILSLEDGGFLVSVESIERALEARGEVDKAA